MRVVALIVALLAIGNPWTAFAQMGVPEIPVPGLGDIARVVPVNGQVVIQYDPILCQQAGPALCGFFRAHEYGHVELGHVITQAFPPKAEFDADCWAATNAQPGEVVAAYQFFMAGGGSGPIHGTGMQRAARVRACADATLLTPQQPPVGITCCTPFFACPLLNPLPQGSQCGCPSPFGIQPGLVCQ